MMDTGELLDFQRAQLERWPMAAANFKALEGVETKIFRGMPFRWLRDLVSFAAQTARQSRWP